MGADPTEREVGVKRPLLGRKTGLLSGLLAESCQPLQSIYPALDGEPQHGRSGGSRKGTQTPKRDRERPAPFCLGQGRQEPLVGHLIGGPRNRIVTCQLGGGTGLPGNARSVPASMMWAASAARTSSVSGTATNRRPTGSTRSPQLPA